MKINHNFMVRNVLLKLLVDVIEVYGGTGQEKCCKNN